MAPMLIFQWKRESLPVPMPIRMTSVRSLRQRKVVVLPGCRVLRLAADRLIGPQPGDLGVLDEALPAAVGCSVPGEFILRLSQS